jgi:hypothetical protein
VKILWGTFHGDQIGSETSGFWETIVKSKIDPSFHDLETRAGKLGKMVIALHPSIV